MDAHDRSRTARRALIAGASSGIGAAFAQRFGAAGYDLALIARRRDRPDALAHEIEGASGVSVEAVVADLAQAQDLRRVEERIMQDDALELLVNCAGFAVISPFHLTDPALLEAMIRLHTVAPMRLTDAALPGMRARDRGSIINVASSGAFLANPDSIWNTYAATKAFVLTFTEGLHEDLSGTGVHVQALCPGWTRTEILQSARRPWDKPDEVTMTPEQVVEASLDGLRRGELICCPGLHDEALLVRLKQAKDAIFNEMNTTGTLARRYLRA
jgi:short-subunit dehydrogenase